MLLAFSLNAVLGPAVLTTVVFPLMIAGIALIAAGISYAKGNMRACSFYLTVAMGSIGFAIAKLPKIADYLKGRLNEYIFALTWGAIGGGASGFICKKQK